MLVGEGLSLRLVGGRLFLSWNGVYCWLPKLVYKLGFSGGWLSSVVAGLVYSWCCSKLVLVGLFLGLVVGGVFVG